MPVEFKARAKTPGSCALAGCTAPGGKIYTGDGLRILACSEGHANAALRRIEQAIAKVSATTEQRDQALRIFNEWGGPRPPQAEGPDAWGDII